MHLLSQSGWVHRIPYLDLSQVTGGATYAYGLTDKGVEEYGGKTFDDHSERTLFHELAISDFHIELKKFCALHSREFSWQQSNLKRGIHPDAYFSITDPKKDGANTNHFFLEIERSKVGNVKNGVSSIIRKLAHYYEIYNTDECKKKWGFKTFRVILLVRSIDRRDNLLRDLEKEYKHRMFWIKPLGIGITDGYRTPKDFELSSYSLFDI